MPSSWKSRIEIKISLISRMISSSVLAVAESIQRKVAQISKIVLKIIGKKTHISVRKRHFSFCWTTVFDNFIQFFFKFFFCSFLDFGVTCECVNVRSIQGNKSKVPETFYFWWFIIIPKNSVLVWSTHNPRKNSQFFQCWFFGCTVKVQKLYTIITTTNFGRRMCLCVWSYFFFHSFASLGHPNDIRHMISMIIFRLCVCVCVNLICDIFMEIYRRSITCEKT